ncbi:MAG TPA: chorismate synthase, partial [Nitrospira sp.]|nr:chorismate synthase [Nitrospira sp.]
HEVPFKTWDAVSGNPFFAANLEVVTKLESFMDELRKSGDSVGARITTVAEHVPVGWGAPVYAKLDADLAAAMMSINAVKAVEIGSGFASVTQRGSELGDELTPDGFVTNHAGGILGGISTGQDIVVTIGIKPTSSIRVSRRSIDKQGNPVTVETNGRHDPCVGIRATPIAEAMVALVLMDHALLHRAQNAAVKTSTPRIAGSVKRTGSASKSKPVAKVNPEPHEA